MIRINLDYPPSANSLWRTGKGGKVYRSNCYKQWHLVASWLVSNMVARDGRVPGPYRLSIRAGRPDNRKRDLDNLLKATSDAIVTGGAVDDDSLCQRIEIEWADVKGIEVTIYQGKPQGVET